MQINDVNLEEFIQFFLGYGNFNSDYWFVGMEEGGGKSFEEINSRLIHWVDGGKKELEDVAEYHQKFGMGYFFKDNPKNQSTWNKLIRIILANEGSNLDLVDVKSFQKTELARTNSNNCLIELFPLPSPSSNKWLYCEILKIGYLKSRAGYKNHLINLRTTSIQEKIQYHSPKMVIFYGNNAEYRKYWSLIAKAPFIQVDIGGKTAYTAEKDGTLFIIVNHPVSTGITNQYFHDIGKLASQKLAS
jgi:hypothetical protein